MTRHLSKRVVTDMLVVAVSVVTITIAATSLGATSLGKSIVAGIAASMPGPFHLATGGMLAGARPSKPKLARAQTGCRLRSALLQWNTDELFAPPAASAR